MPHGKLYPLAAVTCLLTEDPALGVVPADIAVTVGLEACRSNWLGPLLSPWLSYRGVLLLTPVLRHLRGTQITCCSVLLSPFHTNSDILLLSLTLGPPDTRGCLLPQDTVL